MREQFFQDSSNGVSDPLRRRVLIGLGTGLAAAASMGVGQVAGESHDETVSIDNVGTSAWEVTNDDQDVAPTGEENPTLTLQVGTRYLFENGGWGVHPLAFRDASGNSLLTQDGDGSFETDGDVNWVDDGDTAAFTLTQSLADELDDYICTVHPSMNGSVETEQPPAAAVTFSPQTSDGTAVTVDSVRMDDGGFVTMHDDGLLDGDALGSVVGVSDYLASGSYEDVTVDLDEQITETQTLIAMPHRDTNGNEEYDFVDTDGGEDSPYVDDTAITDSAEVTVPPAAVTFSPQTTDGTSVIVDSVRMNDGGFVTMHDDGLLDGDALGSVVGVSAYLAPGTSENVGVDLDEQLEESGTLIAMPHRDTNDNESYDFVETEGGEDGPYTDADGAITDGAEVILETETSAAVTFADQTTGGASVIVDSVRMDDGGFVTMHDGGLLDGDALGSVVGVSEYLDPGTSENVVVGLDGELAADQTLIAMPHRDTNDNETYDFVATDGGEDGPYTDVEGPVTDAGEVTVAAAPAAVTFADQTSDGTSVTVDSVRMDEGGFVTMHDDGLLDGDALGSVVGVSEYLDPGTSENVVVVLDERLEGTQTLIAMPHRDTNDNETYDFVDTDGGEDAPYVDADGPVTDPGEVTVPPAAVTFSPQTSDGTAVTVDSVRMDDGGFVTMHDDGLLDGDALGSVVGVSEYLDPGTSENVTVDLDEPLTETGTLIAMPHRDTNDNETYDFVETDGGEDGPYTDAEGAIVDPAEVTVPPAAVTFADQSTTGASVTVDSVRVNDGGFVTMHDDGLLGGDPLGSVVGVSDYLDPGSYDGLTVDLDEPLEESGTLIAMPHRDTNDNETYDFVETEGGEDGPYTDAEGAITDAGEVTVDSGTEVDAPGFGLATGAAGLGGLAAYAYKKLNLDAEPPTPSEDGLDDGEDDPDDGENE